jgi:hypothetical protein
MHSSKTVSIKFDCHVTNYEVSCKVDFLGILYHMCCLNVVFAFQTMGDFHVHHVQFFNFVPQAVHSMAFCPNLQKLAVARWDFNFKCIIIM